MALQGPTCNPATMSFGQGVINRSTNPSILPIHPSLIIMDSLVIEFLVDSYVYSYPSRNPGSWMIAFQKLCYHPDSLYGPCHLGEHYALMSTECVDCDELNLECPQPGMTVKKAKPKAGYVRMDMNSSKAAWMTQLCGLVGLAFVILPTPFFFCFFAASLLLWFKSVHDV